MAVDARRRERTLPFVLVLLAVVAYATWLLRGHAAEGRALASREDRARDALVLVREAQLARRDAVGSFGTWADLEREAHLPAGMTLLDAHDDAHVVVDGYRLDVLLPWRLEAGRLVRVARPTRHDPDPELSTRHVLLVARPLQPGKDGYRTYATDETGVVWIAEGVSDDITAARNLLPDAHLSTSAIADTSGRVWHRLDKMVPFGEDGD
ncbi:MAG: hypothetical protein H6806_11465 [Planctomycetes bacterium]|nr:hypothetical protein [Planctomycetota bacterium]MCB9830361.1 hypothetical protein [Planctomycetota bacterium]MCB9900661.1 hypothetical protein [Planctomycetota bacterium]